MNEVDRVVTGIKGFDEVLNGGLPKARTILVVGSPGSGKTTFAVQFLVGGAKAGEPSLYVSLDEKPERVKVNLSSFGWNLDSLEDAGKLTFIDATQLKRPGQRISQPNPCLGKPRGPNSPRVNFRVTCSNHKACCSGRRNAKDCSRPDNLADAPLS